MLSDRDLKKAIRTKKLSFSPKLKPGQIGPASIDLKLSPHFKFFRIDKFSYVYLSGGCLQTFLSRRDSLQ